MNSGAGSRLQTVDNALDLLEYLAAEPGPKSLADLCEEFGRSKATVYRLAVTLKQRGFLVQESDTGHYRFGWACARLATSAKEGMSVTETCLPFMREIRNKTGETIYLALYQGEQAVAVESIQSPRPVVATSVLGHVLPLHAVSAGLVILAGQSDDRVTKILSSKLQRYTPQTVTNPKLLRKDISQIRQDGYAVNREGYRPGVSGIAAPIRVSSDGAVIGALSACMPTPRMDLSLATDVVWAADRASEALAGHLSPKGNGRRAVPVSKAASH